MVERVISQYGAEADRRVQEVSHHYEQRIAEVQGDANARASKAEKKAQSVAEELRRRDLMIEGRARKWANWVVGSLYWFAVTVVLIGAVGVTITHSFAGGLIEAFVGVAVVLFVMLEVFGVLSHLRSIKAILESRLRQKLRTWFVGGTSTDGDQ